MLRPGGDAMVRVPVDVANDPNGARMEDAPGVDPIDVDATEDSSRRRRTARGGDIEIEREITKRQIIQSVTSIVVVVLYMVFSLLRDRDTGVVVIDPDEGGPDDDWKE